VVRSARFVGRLEDPLRPLELVLLGVLDSCCLQRAARLERVSPTNYQFDLSNVDLKDTMGCPKDIRYALVRVSPEARVHLKPSPDWN
jgi:hypothetical protein